MINFIEEYSLEIHYQILPTSMISVPNNVGTNDILKYLVDTQDLRQMSRAPGFVYLENGLQIRLDVVLRDNWVQLIRMTKGDEFYEYRFIFGALIFREHYRYNNGYQQLLDVTSYNTLTRIEQGPFDKLQINFPIECFIQYSRTSLSTVTNYYHDFCFNEAAFQKTE